MTINFKYNNMKTKEQVIMHLKVAGYKKSEISKIMGFLIGNGTKAPREIMHYVIGTGTFDDFLAWYQSEQDVMCDEVNCPIRDMFATLFLAMDMAEAHCETSISETLDELLDKMLGVFVEDVSNKNDNGKQN